MDLWKKRQFRFCLYFMLGFIWLAVGSPAIAQVLDVKEKGVKRMEISSGFGGYRDTLIFYTFENNYAILKLTIDNKDKTFPIKGDLIVFEETVVKDGIKKWLNNQHSDALYPDVPKPKSKHKLAPKSVKVLKNQLTGSSKSRTGRFDDYTVHFQLDEIMKVGKFSLKSFKDKATVHVKSK